LTAPFFGLEQTLQENILSGGVRLGLRPKPLLVGRRGQASAFHILVECSTSHITGRASLLFESQIIFKFFGSKKIEEPKQDSQDWLRPLIFLFFVIGLVSTHHFFRNACTKSGSLRISQFAGC
jgi:hypothetical protein